MCSSADTRATVRPTGFYQNRGAGFPRPTRHSSWPPAVKFAPCEPYAESQVLQRFEADATFTHVELLAALLVFAGEPDGESGMTVESRLLPKHGEAVWSGSDSCVGSGGLPACLREARLIALRNAAPKPATRDGSFLTVSRQASRPRYQ